MNRINKIKQLSICDAYLIVSEVNRFYLSGYRTSYGYILITNDQVFYLTDYRYYEEAVSVLSGKDIAVVAGNDAKVKSKLAEVINSYNIKTLGFEANRVTYDDYMQLKQLFSSFGDGLTPKLFDFGEKLDMIRVIKEDSEIDSIAKAQQITDKAFSKILGFIKPGLTEREICNELNHQMMLSGAESIAFDTIIASGNNSSRPHSGVSNKKVASGEFITMDFGAKVNGYCSDMTRTVALGKVSDEMVTVYNAVLKAQQVSINAYKEHVSCKEAFTIAKTCLQTSGGYGDYFIHGLGHGVGLEIHEYPGINSVSDSLLLPGMVVSVEPGVYLENKFGVRIEDLIVIKENGIKNLTASDKQLITL